MPMRAYFMCICPDSIVSGNLCHAFRPLQESCAQPTAVRATDTATAWQPSKVCLLPPSSSRLPISIDYRPSRTIHSVPPIRTPLWHRPQPSSVPRSYPRCFAIVSHAYQLLNHSEYGACRCIWRETASANQGMRAHSRTWAQTDRGSSRGSGWWKMYQEMSPDDLVNNFMHFEHVCCMRSPPFHTPSGSPP